MSMPPQNPEMETLKFESESELAISWVYRSSEFVFNPPISMPEVCFLTFISSVY